MQTALTLVALAANVATIIAVVLLIRQIAIAAEQTRLAKEAMQAERDREDAEQARRRNTLLEALSLEVHAIRDSIDLDERLFHPESGTQDERAKARHIALTTEKGGYTRGYVWTPLPFGIVEQAIRDAYFLRLTEEQVSDLLTLRLGILRANAAAAMKLSIMPALMEGETATNQRLSMSYRRLVDAKIDNLNTQVQEEFREIRKLLHKIIQWLDEEQQPPG